MKSIDVNGMNVAYREQNSTGFPTIVFVHGNSQSSNSFNNQLNSKQLSECHLIAIDLPGHGKSDNIQDYSLKNLGTILAKFINRLSLQNVLIVGHSLGGHVAIHSLNFVETDGLLLFGTPPLSNPVTLDGFLPNPFAAPLSSESATDQELLNLLTELELHDDQLIQAKLDYERSDPLFRKVLFATTFQNEHDDEWKTLCNVKTKTKILLLRNDRFINTEFIIKMAKNVPSVSFEELKSCHSPHQNNPTEFNDSLSLYLGLLFNNIRLNEQLAFRRCDDSS